MVTPDRKGHPGGVRSRLSHFSKNPCATVGKIEGNPGGLTFSVFPPGAEINKQVELQVLSVRGLSPAASSFLPENNGQNIGK